MSIANSLKQAVLLPSSKVRVLSLRASPDLVCRNLMCEKLNEPCVCKLARFVAQNDFTNLEELYLNQNRLTLLPGAIFLPSLKLLDVSHNNLKFIHLNDLTQCSKLERLNVSNNPLSEEWKSNVLSRLRKDLEVLF
jgi:Leucine-rich repeat (LRR) protein